MKEIKISSDGRMQIVREIAPTYKATTPEEAVSLWRDVVEESSWYTPLKECVVSLIVNTKYRVIAIELVSIGSLNESIVQPREVFRGVIVAGGYGCVLMHNHPSGDPSHSQPDVRIARMVREAATILRLEMLDFIIVGDPAVKEPGYESLQKIGLI